jgi:hypothetical protein
MVRIQADLPATRFAAELDIELRLCPAIDREDAVQEAWLAALEGRNPARAVNSCARRERRRRVRERSGSPGEEGRVRLSAMRQAAGAGRVARA